MYATFFCHSLLFLSHKIRTHSIYYGQTKPHCYNDDDDYSLCRHQSIQQMATKMERKKMDSMEMVRELNTENVFEKGIFPLEKRKLDGVSICYVHF